MIKQVEYNILPQDKRYEVFVDKIAGTDDYDGYVLVWGNSAYMLIHKTEGMYFMGKTDNEEVGSLGRKCWFPEGMEITFEDLYDLLLQGVDIMSMVHTKQNYRGDNEDVEKKIIEIRDILGEPLNQ